MKHSIQPVPLVAPAGELDLLTSARFLAALWVVFHHFGGSLTSDTGTFGTFISHFFRSGDMGVKFFFVLSGFILTHVYGSKTSINVKAFLFARFARIYPVYVLALLLSLPSLLSQIDELIVKYSMGKGLVIGALKAASVLSLTQAWAPSFALFWNGVSWSLSAELFFYASFPLLMPFLRNRGIFGLAAGLILCMLIEIALTTCKILHPSLAWGFTPLFRIHDFALGIILRLFLCRGLRLPLWSVIPALGVFVYANAAPTLPLYPRYLLSMLSIAWIIPALAISRMGTRPSKPLAGLILLGQGSYSLYLLHYPVMVLWKSAIGANEVPNFWAYLATVIAISIAIFVFIEEPCRRILRQLLTSQRPAAVGTIQSSA